MHIRYDSGEGPPVVLLHGQPGSASDWVRVVPLLRDAGVRAIAVDRPGYAGSKRDARDWRGNARALIERLAELDLGPATLVGWSWGGGVALEAAKLAPEAVSQLVLVASVGHESAIGPIDHLLAAPGIRQAAPALMNLLAGRASGIFAAAGGSQLDREARAFLHEEVSLYPATKAWASFASEQLSMVRDAAGLSLTLPVIETPATVVHGWRDAYVPMRAAGALAAALPNARLIPVDGGHYLPYELPAQLAAVIAGVAVSALP